MKASVYRRTPVLAHPATPVTLTHQWPMQKQRKETAMTTTKTLETDQNGEQPALRTPAIVPPEAWEAARQQMLVKEKALTRARDALAAERRRMPWMAAEKAYIFEGPRGRVSLLELFEGRRQLIL